MFDKKYEWTCTEYVESALRVKIIDIVEYFHML